MKVFKFGGASVKDAEGVKNVKSVLEIAEPSANKEILMVVSAMGKTTNALEEVIELYQSHAQDPSLYQNKIQEIALYHKEIISGLFADPTTVNAKVDGFFAELQGFLERNKSPKYNFVYDQVIGYGELVSTVIVSEYLNQEGFSNIWLDVRDYIKTDSNFREGKIQWEETQKAISGLDKSKFYVTQGFLGSNEDGMMVTLGREGSDYTGAIFAYCLDAQSMTIWKDVPGVLSGDPRVFKDTVLLNHISYQEAIELSYYGASVIHPKTLQPLQKKEIPFFVKSFLNPEKDGTAIKKGAALEPYTPCFILKKDQILMELSTKDFTFITEDHFSEIFTVLAQHRVKVNMIQNSAIHLSLVLEDKLRGLDGFLEQISSTYNCSVQKDVNLYTIRHYDKDSEEKITEGKPVLLKQKIKNTLQIVMV
ncbi:MAG: aspartate kinase [Flavobacteriaceae bacterium]|nr:MAG: aspartate kinase [Flavobacteriaceae bacterium]